MRSPLALLALIAVSAPFAPGLTATASAQARRVAATLEASEPEQPAAEDPPLDRSFAVSVTLGAGVASWHDYIEYYNEEEHHYDAVEVSGDAFFVAEMTGFAGVPIVTSADGTAQHLLGYLLDASVDDTGVLHRHQLAYRLDSRTVGLTLNLGLSALTPYEGGSTHLGFGIGVGAHVYLAGPLFTEFRYQADLMGTGGVSMETYSLAIGLANL